MIVGWLKRRGFVMLTGWEFCQSWTVGDTGITQQGKHKYKKRLRKFETKFYTTNIVRKTQVFLVFLPTNSNQKFNQIFISSHSQAWSFGSQWSWRKLGVIVMVSTHVMVLAPYHIVILCYGVNSWRWTSRLLLAFQFNSFFNPSPSHKVDPIDVLADAEWEKMREER